MCEEENSIDNTFRNGVLRKNRQTSFTHTHNSADKQEVLHLSIVNNHKNKITDNKTVWLKGLNLPLTEIYPLTLG